MASVLAGIRVLDYGRFIAAPWCSAILADMGADVIRIEKREGGEDRWVQPVAKGGEGATFLQCNRNKRSLTLDLTTPLGAEVNAKLVASADVVISNMPDAATRQVGLDYQTLRRIKSDIILANATAFGSSGPYANRVGFDGVGQVMSGGVYRSGLPDLPIRSAVPYVDFGTALSLALGTMMALFHRQRTGIGQEVQADLLPVALMMANGMLIEQEILQVNRTRVGNCGIAVAPCDLFKVEDGWVLVQIAGQAMFNRWCRLIGEETWRQDPRFASDDLRAQQALLLNGAMQRWCEGKTREELIRLLDSARIPVGPLYSCQEALDDPHVRQMEFFKQLDYPGLSRPAPVIRTPFSLSEAPAVTFRRAPTLGEHTVKILGDLGYDAEAIGRLEAEKVI